MELVDIGHYIYTFSILSLTRHHDMDYDDDTFARDRRLFLKSLFDSTIFTFTNSNECDSLFVNDSMSPFTTRLIEAIPNMKIVLLKFNLIILSIWWFSCNETKTIPMPLLVNVPRKGGKAHPGGAPIH